MHSLPIAFLPIAASGARLPLEPGSDGGILAAMGPTLAWAGLALAVGASAAAWLSVWLYWNRKAPWRNPAPTAARPEGITVQDAAALLGRSSLAETALVVERVVEGDIRIVSTGPGELAIDLLTPLGAIESKVPFDTAQTLQALFPYGVTRVSVDHSGEAVRARLADLAAHRARRLVADGFRRESVPASGKALFYVAEAGVAATFLGFMGVAEAFGPVGWLPAVGLVLAAAAAVAGVTFANLRIDRTGPAGRHVRVALEGLRAHLRSVAVESNPAPTSAAATAAASAATATTVGDLEAESRLLPYAVVFGLEREWTERLARAAARRGETLPWWPVPVGTAPESVALGVAGFVSTASATWAGATAPTGPARRRAGYSAFSGRSWSRGWSWRWNWSDAER